MTDQDSEPDRPSGAPPATSPVRTGGTLWWLIPAVTFLAGVLLGAVVMAAVRSDDTSTADRRTGSPTATPTPSRTSPADLTITVPGECVRLADDSRTASDLLGQAAAAARDLDASRLADIVRRMEDARNRLESGATACRNAATGTSATTTTTG